MDELLLTFFVLLMSVFIGLAAVVMLLLWRAIIWCQRIYAVLNRPY